MTETELDAILSDPLAEARAAGGAIGYVGFDIPQDILLSPGLNAFHLPWRPEGGGAAAEKWTESSFPPLAKSILQQWADGVFDNIIRAAGVKSDPANPNGACAAVEPTENIRITGRNNAVIEGADNPYTAANPKTGVVEKWLGDYFGWRTVGILLSRASRAWGSSPPRYRLLSSTTRSNSIVSSVRRVASRFSRPSCSPVITSSPA